MDDFVIEYIHRSQRIPLADIKFDTSRTLQQQNTHDASESSLSMISVPEEPESQQQSQQNDQSQRDNSDGESGENEGSEGDLDEDGEDESSANGANGTKQNEFGDIMGSDGEEYMVIKDTYGNWNIDSFASEYKKVLRNIHPDSSLGKESIPVLDQIIVGSLKMIAKEASRICTLRNGVTLTHEDIQAAVLQTITFRQPAGPTDFDSDDSLAKHAIAEGSRAYCKFYGLDYLEYRAQQQAANKLPPN